MSLCLYILCCPIVEFVTYKSLPIGIFTFLVVEITPVSITNIGWRTYVYFCVFNFCFLPLIYFFYPETRNLSLEQIDKLFSGDKVMLHWTPSMGSVSGEESSANPTMVDKAANSETFEYNK